MSVLDDYVWVRRMEATWTVNLIDGISNVSEHVHQLEISERSRPRKEIYGQCAVGLAGIDL